MAHDHPNVLPPPFPTTSSYTPLAEYEASTPQTFFTTKEVLYASLDSCSICVSRSAIANYDEWVDFFGTDASNQHDTAPSDGEDWAVKPKASGFIGSGYVTLLPNAPVIDPQSQPITSNSAKPPSGLQIPYPSIHLHAVRILKHPAMGLKEGEEKGALYLQVDMGPRPGMAADEDEPGEHVVEVLLVPDVVTAAPLQGADTVESSHLNGTAPQTGSASNSAQVQDLYTALSTCQDLHPDPGDDSDEEDHGRSRGGLAGLLAGMSGEGGGMPGEGGWITSENAHLFEGEFPDVDVGQTEGDDDIIPLGPGAGTRRDRDGEEDNEVNGTADTDDTKWQRTG